MKWGQSERYRPLSAMTNDEHAKLKQTVDHSPWRQRYHIQPPTGLLNDPNGFSYYNGQYHLFYQWFPFGAVHGLKHWYHTTSEDLATWKDEGVAIEPNMPFESHGAYSGSGIVHEDQLYLLYTGNTRDGNWLRTANQCLATMNSAGHITKHPVPLIIGSPQGYTEHFRDPKVWRQNEQFYFVIGAQRNTKTGCALLYQSSDLYEWNFVGEIKTSYEDFGYMWECPDYFELDGNGILLFSPQGIEAQGEKYRNVYQSGYLAGETLDVETGKWKHGEFIELDAGFDFYAPQTTTTPDGRRILIGWMGLPDVEYPTDRYDWAHCLTIPRELSWQSGKLYQRPVKELLNRRKDHKTFFSSEGMYESVIGETYEMKLSFFNHDAKKYGVSLRTSKTENTFIVYDTTTKRLNFDRSTSGEHFAEEFGTNRSVLIEDEEALTLHIFVDHSSVELFVNDGAYVFTSRIFPSREAIAFQTFATDGTTRIEGECWNIE